MATRTTTTEPFNRRFSTHAGATAAATEFGAVHFKNPSSSGFDAVIKRIIIDAVSVAGTELPYTVNHGRLDTDLSTAPTYAAATRSFNSYEDGGDSVCVVSGNSVASASTDAPTVSFGKVAVGVDETVIIEFGDPDDAKSGLRIKPGTGYVCKCQDNALTDIDATFIWDEFPSGTNP